MLDCIQSADVPQAPAPVAYLTPNPRTWKNYTSCPWSKSIVVRCPETGQSLLCAVTCKRWGCGYCARLKIRRLAFLTHGAKPNRWIRLGVKPDKYPSPRDAWEHTSPLIPEVCKVLRRERGECEYLRVTELHQSGFPHYHALLRSSFIPQKLLSDTWGALTGAPVVWIAKIDQSFSTFRYLVKYLTKLHKIEWTDRHVSYSRNFFNPEDLEKIAYPQRDVLNKSDDHPWKYLTDRYRDQQVAVTPRGEYVLPYDHFGEHDDTPLHELGLSPPPAEQPPEKWTQADIPGLEKARQPRYDDYDF